MEKDVSALIAIKIARAAFPHCEDIHDVDENSRCRGPGAVALANAQNIRRYVIALELGQE